MIIPDCFAFIEVPLKFFFFMWYEGLMSSTFSNHTAEINFQVSKQEECLTEQSLLKMENASLAQSCVSRKIVNDDYLELALICRDKV